MCSTTHQNEKNILKFSAAFAMLFTVSGILLGLIADSIVMMFDGLYSLVSVLLTLLALAASHSIQASKQPEKIKKLVELSVIAIKGSVIVSVVTLSLIEALIAIANGGRHIELSLATVFAFINVLGCGYAWWAIHQKQKINSSELVRAELKQWQMDTLLSVAIAGGFLATWGLSFTPWAQYGNYADPMMMVAMSFYFIKVPLHMLVESISGMMRLVKQLNRHNNKSLLDIGNLMWKVCVKQNA